MLALRAGNYGFHKDSTFILEQLVETTMHDPLKEAPKRSQPARRGDCAATEEPQENIRHHWPQGLTAIGMWPSFRTVVIAFMELFLRRWHAQVWSERDLNNAGSYVASRNR